MSYSSHHPENQSVVGGAQNGQNAHYSHPPPSQHHHNHHLHHSSSSSQLETTTQYPWPSSSSTQELNNYHHQSSIPPTSSTTTTTATSISSSNNTPPLLTTAAPTATTITSASNSSSNNNIANQTNYLSQAQLTQHQQQQPQVHVVKIKQEAISQDQPNVNSSSTNQMPPSSSSVHISSNNNNPSSSYNNGINPAATNGYLKIKQEVNNTQQQIPQIKREALPLPQLASQESEISQPNSPQETLLNIKISNVVCKFRVRCHVNLQDLATKAFNTEYDRQRGRVMMRLRNPPCYISG